MSQIWMPKDENGKGEPYSVSIDFSVKDIPVLIFAFKSQINQIFEAAFLGSPKQDEIKPIRNILSRSVAILSAAHGVLQDLVEEDITEQDHTIQHLTDHEWDVVTNILTNDPPYEHLISENEPCVLCKRGVK